METKLTIKELSTIVGIPSRTIRYYDEIGLFKSSGTLENGYRYYTVDRIEEINLIIYLRHIGISIGEIRKHLENRNIDDYSNILDEQLNRIKSEILKLEKAQYRIERRMASIKFIRSIKDFSKIKIESFPDRRIIYLYKELSKKMEWELYLNQIYGENNLSKGIMVGDIGFFVDINKVDTREAYDFSGIFFVAEDSLYDSFHNITTFEAGNWLTLYLRGDHQEAKRHYPSLMEFAKSNNLKLHSHALERTIIDHYISSDPDLYITEISIKIMDS